MATTTQRPTKTRGGYRFSASLTPNTVACVFLAQAYRFDLEYLLLLYDKVGEDLFFLFFLFAGKQIQVPKHAKMYRILTFAEKACTALKTGAPLEPQTRQEREVCERLQEYYDPKKACFILDMEVRHREVVPAAPE